MRLHRVPIAIVVATVVRSGAAWAQTCDRGECYETSPAQSPNEPRIALPTFEARVGYENAFVVDSAFNAAARQFGYFGFDDVQSAIAEGAWLPNRYLQVGGRFGYGWASTGQVYSNGAQLDERTESLGAFVGLRTPPSARRVFVDFGGRVEADALLGETSLRGETHVGAGARVGSRMELGLVIRPVVFTASLGYQWFQFDSGGPVPISMAGPFVGLDAGVRL